MWRNRLIKEEKTPSTELEDSVERAYTEFRKGGKKPKNGDIINCLRLLELGRESEISRLTIAVTTLFSIRMLKLKASESWKFLYDFIGPAGRSVRIRFSVPRIRGRASRSLYFRLIHKGKGGPGNYQHFKPITIWTKFLSQSWNRLHRKCRNSLSSTRTTDNWKYIFVVVSPFVIACIHFFFFQLQYLFMQFLHERSR